MCGLQPKHELLCSKFTLCGLTGKTAENHVLVSKVIFCFISLQSQSSFVRFLVTSRVSAFSLRHDIAVQASSSISNCVPSYKLSLGSQRNSKQMGRVQHPGPTVAPKMQMLCPKWEKALDWTWTQLPYISQDWGINRKRRATVKCSLSGGLQANHSCYNQLLFPSYLLPTTNSQRQEIERWERKRDSLENRTKDRALIAKTWKTSLTCSTSNLCWILNIQFKLTHSEIKINTLLFWFLYMLNLLL